MQAKRYSMKENLDLQLSIIVPVYNVEKYIRECLESIFKQELNDEDFEVIIVNDGTKDRSIEVIQDIIDSHNNITVVNQENQGLSVARNVGISMAQGEYILMQDSDDLLFENSLKPLLEKALESKADLVVADFLSMSDEEIEQKMPYQHYQKPVFDYKEKTGEQLFLEDLNPYQCYVWRTLFKREFLLDINIKFVPGIYIQDVPFTHESYLKAKKCIRTSWLLNIYRRGHESATFSFNLKKVRDFCTAIAKTWELTHLDGLSIKVQDKLQEDVYTSFSMMTWVTTHKIASASDRIDVIDYMKRQAPDLWFRIGIRQKVVSYLYRYFPHLFIRLRYFYAIIVENNIRPFINHRLKKLFSEI